MLDLALGHLGAIEALTECAEGNGASEQVSLFYGGGVFGMPAVRRPSPSADGCLTDPGRVKLK